MSVMFPHCPPQLLVFIISVMSIMKYSSATFGWHVPTRFFVVLPITTLQRLEPIFAFNSGIKKLYSLTVRGITLKVLGIVGLEEEIYRIFCFKKTSVYLLRQWEMWALGKIGKAWNYIEKHKNAKFRRL